MGEPLNNEIRDLWVWEDRANGRPMESGIWHSPFPKDLTVGGEGFPIGTAAVAGNSHNQEPRQTLCIVLRDAVSGFQTVSVPFRDIKGGYQPEGAAHVLLHRDYPWQNIQLRVIGYSGGALTRIYTWRYLVQKPYRWEQATGKWIATT